MSFYKYVANRILAAFENVILVVKLSEYIQVTVDNKTLVLAVSFSFRINEISCSMKYFPGASSISFWPSVRYGLAMLATMCKYLLRRSRMKSYAIFGG